MQTLIIVVHVIAALAIVGLVLLQQGKGADAGASFGAGASQTVFGASGSGNFLVRATTISAVIFFVTSLSLAIFAKNQAGTGTTVGLPIVNQEILDETTASQTDIPTLVEEQQAPPQSDVPTLPNN
jgi:preprotein translocase subunit SecG